MFKKNHHLTLKPIAFFLFLCNMNVSMANNEPTSVKKYIDPFAGQELELEKLQRELVLQKAVVASLKEALAMANTENDIKLAELKGQYDQKKVKKDTEKLEDSKSYNPNLPSMTILPPLAGTANPVDAQAKSEPKEKKPVVKKEEKKPDVLLGSVKFGKESPVYMVETGDGKYTTSNEKPAKAIQTTPSGYYTVVSESDVYKGGGGEGSNSFGKKGVQAPFGNNSASTPGSIPLAMPSMNTSMSSNKLIPQPFD